MFRRTRSTERRLAAVEITTDAARIALAVSTPSGVPQLTSIEEISRDRLHERVLQLDDEYRRSGLPLAWYTVADPRASRTCTTRIADEFQGADARDQELACLHAEGFTPEVIEERDLQIRTEMREDRCVILAVDGSEVDRLAQLVPAENLFIATSAMTLSAVATRAAAESFDLDAGLTLVIQCTYSAIATVAIARGRVVMTHLIPLALLLAEEASTQARAGSASGPSERGPRHFDPAQYVVALDNGVELSFRLLSELFEQPSTLKRILLTGEACAELPLLEDLADRYGHALEIARLQTSRCVAYIATTDAERELSRQLYDAQDMNAVVFGLLALAADPSSNALAAHVPAPLPTAPSRFGTFAKFASDRNARTVALTALLLVALGFGLPYWLASRALASAERDLAYEHKLEQTYNEYEAERERVEAEMQHEQQLLEIINAKRDAQLVPKQVTDDIDRAFASVPGLRGSDDPHNRIEFSETRWDGSTVTISGRTWYLENATNFGQALGALDDRTRFTDVQTTHRELTSAPTPDAPDGELVYDFVVRAKYTPPAAK